MALHLWNPADHFRKQPSTGLLTRYGRKQWDVAVKREQQENPVTANKGKIFTMPSFGKHGRWGNMVFQYIFIRIAQLNNNAGIELCRDNDYISNTMLLYQDMAHIPAIKTQPHLFLLDSYQHFTGEMHYIPGIFMRAMYVSEVRRQQCFIIKDTAKAIDKPLLLPDNAPVEVEGLFMVNPRLFNQHKDFILKEMFKPTAAFNKLIQGCVQQMGQNKTIIGIHIRRGDFIHNPLGQSFQFPISAKYYIAWLAAHLSSIKNPVIYVCSDDSNAYKEFEMAGFEVFCTEKLLPEDEPTPNAEQLDWNILRHCHVLLSSNSSYSFSAAFLSFNQPRCYRFSLSEKAFVAYNPWDAEPLKHFPAKPYLWGHLYSRFKFVLDTVSTRKAAFRIKRDAKAWMLWKITKPLCLYYVYGVSLKSVSKLFNVFEFFRHQKNQSNPSRYDDFKKISL